MLRLLKFLSYLCSVKTGPDTAVAYRSAKQQGQSKLLKRPANRQQQPKLLKRPAKQQEQRKRTAAIAEFNKNSSNHGIRTLDRKKNRTDSDPKLSSDLQSLEEIQAARKRFSPFSYKDAAVDSNGQRRVTLYKPASFNLEKKENLPTIRHGCHGMWENEIDVHEVIVPKQNASDRAVAQDIWSRNFAITEASVLSRDHVEKNGSLSAKSEIHVAGGTMSDPVEHITLGDYVPTQEAVNIPVKKKLENREFYEGVAGMKFKPRATLSFSDVATDDAILAVGKYILGLTVENGWSVVKDDDIENRNRFIFTNQFPEPEKNLPYCLKQVIIEPSRIGFMDNKRNLEWLLRHSLDTQGTLTVLHTDHPIPNPKKKDPNDPLTYELNLWVPPIDKYLAIVNPTSEANSTLRPSYSEIMTPEFKTEESEHPYVINEKIFIQDRLKKYLTIVDLINSNTNHMIAFFSAVKGNWSDGYPLAVPHIGVDSDKTTEIHDKNNFVVKSAETRFQVQLFKAK